MIIQIFLWSIALLSAFIAHEFWISKDGRLRILIIELFLAKMIVYGGGAALLAGWLNFMDADYVRILINLPMLIVMLRLYAYIRIKK